MDQLKLAAACFAAEISHLKRLGWKDRLSMAGLYLVFWGGLFAGLWQIGQGFYEGPNFAAARVVVVDYIAEWRAEGRHDTSIAYWTVGYHFVSSKGETISRRISVNSDDPAASRVRNAEVGNEILIRVGVPMGEPGAEFGINKAVRQGLAIVLVLPMLAYFFRESFLETGKVTTARIKVIKFWLIFCGAMFVLLWLTSPVIP